MKNSVFYFLLLFSSVLFSQESHNFNGIVTDAITGEPISDVLILQHNELVSFTNFDGKFELETILSENDSLTFKHFSFKKKTIALNSTFSKINIMLESNVNVLDEVLIGFDDEALGIISNARKKFKNSFRKKPYWASSNLKQVVKFNDTLPAYLEIDGNTFMVGDDKDVWNLPILVPIETRRTKERFNEVFGKNEKEKNPEFYANLGINQTSDAFLLSYRFFEFAHPLTNKGKRNYYFTLESTSLIDGELCYTIGYKSIKEKNEIKGRDFYSMQGQIVLSKETLSLKKITSLHRRSTYSSKNGVDNILTVNYKEIDGLIYPKNISYIIDVNFKKRSINLQGVLSFSKINTKEVENYRKTISSNSNLFHFHEVYNTYNDSYWKNKQTNINLLQEKFFGKKIENKAFLKGELQKIKPKNLYPGTRENEKLILEKMKTDL